VGIFAVIANRLFGRRYGAWVAILGIAAYTILVGASASVVRAAIMGGLALTAQQIGRWVYGLNTLAIAALLTTLINPLILPAQPALMVLAGLALAQALARVPAALFRLVRSARHRHWVILITVGFAEHQRY
jgi:competence protein ComEC